MYKKIGEIKIGYNFNIIAAINEIKLKFFKFRCKKNIKINKKK